jgi:inner membrane protein YidH
LALWREGLPVSGETRPAMIRSYTDHAANERTFLAWLRTGIAVIAFGFLIEKFDLFVVTMAAAVSADAASRADLEGLSHSYSRGVGHAFILVGIVFIVVATIRFVRTGYLLDDQKIHSPGIVADLSLSVILAILLIAVSVPLILL